MPAGKNHCEVIIAHSITKQEQAQLPDDEVDF